MNTIFKKHYLSVIASIVCKTLILKQLMAASLCDQKENLKGNNFLTM